MNNTWSTFENEPQYTGRESIRRFKMEKSYKRLFGRGKKNVILELTLISCGFNLYKYHNKRQRKEPAIYWNWRSLN